MRWGDAKKERPVLELTPSRSDQALDVASAVLVVLAAAGVALNWHAIPPLVPTHFGISGQPDAWGPRWIVALVPLLALCVHIGLGLVYRYPHSFNYPWKITAENAEAQYRLARSLIAWEKFWVVLMFYYLSQAQVRVATGHIEALSSVLMTGFIVGLVLSVVVFMVLMHRAR